MQGRDAMIGRVLIIDDLHNVYSDKRILKRTIELLKEADLGTPLHETDGGKGLEVAKRNLAVKAVILDKMLQDQPLDSHDICQGIKSARPDVKVIVLTSDVEDNFTAWKNFREVGADEFFPKSWLRDPAKADKFVSCIMSAVHGGVQRQFEIVIGDKKDMIRIREAGQSGDIVKRRFNEDEVDLVRILRDQTLLDMKSGQNDGLVGWVTIDDLAERREQRVANRANRPPERDPYYKATTLPHLRERLNKRIAKASNMRIVNLIDARRGDGYRLHIAVALESDD